jgi:hypothetical protein
MPSACHCLSSEDAIAYDVPPPEQCPEPGYYYHYKHDPNGPLNNYTYYIYGDWWSARQSCFAGGRKKELTQLAANQPI